MTIYDLARELGQELLKTSEIENMMAAKKEYEADEKAVELIIEYNQYQKDYQQKLQNPILTKEEYETLTNELREKADIISNYEPTAKLIAAEQKFNELLNQVFTIVTATISGEEQESCGEGGCSSGCCGSCEGGCH